MPPALCGSSHLAVAQTSCQLGPDRVGTVGGRGPDRVGTVGGRGLDDRRANRGRQRSSARSLTCPNPFADKMPGPNRPDRQRPIENPNQLGALFTEAEHEKRQDEIRSDQPTQEGRRMRRIDLRGEPPRHPLWQGCERQIGDRSEGQREQVRRIPWRVETRDTKREWQYDAENKARFRHPDARARRPS